MTEEIIVDLDIARNRYSEYTQKFPGKKFHKCFEFDTNISIKDNLNQLSFFALDETLPVLYSFPEIFFDLISRWVEEPTYFDSQYKKAFNLSHFNIDGSIIIYSLSKLVKVSNEPLNLIEFYLNNNDIFDRLHKSISLKNSISAPELEIILLAFFRLIDYDNFKFRRFINPKVLHSLLSIELEEYNVVKYLTVLLLGSYLESSEAVLNQMLATHTISSSLISNYEQDKIDYRFLNIVEAKRIENFHNSLKDRTNSNLNTSKNSKLSINQSHFSGLVTSIYGVLVPHLISSSSTEQQKDTLVTTENSINVLKRLATNIQNNHPTLLFGKAGSGKTFLFNQLAKIMGYQDSIVKIHLGEQTDAKLLLGTYSSGEKPGTFKWRSGVLTTAVKEGKWVLIEDIDKAPTEVLSILLTLLEKRQLIIPSRGEVIKAHNNFQLISTIRIANDNTQNQVPDLIGLRLWHLVEVKVPSEFELMKILSMKFPLLSKLNRTFIKCYNEILKIYSTHSFVALNRGSHPRLISSRDLIKFCSRCNKILINSGITSTEQLLESSIYDNFFQEAIDCFGSAITEHEALIPLSNTIGECLEVPPSRINLFLSKHIPMFMDDENSLRVGRAILPKSLSDKALNRSKKSNNVTSFATTNHSLRLMEQICVSIEMLEPVLLVGETGTGKTTVVQQVAKLMNKKLTVINVSQQTESGDLLGGYKPVNTKIIAIPLQEVFENLFITTFSRKKNEKFSMILSKVFNRNQWKNVIKLWREAIKMAKELLDVEVESESDNDGTDTPKKKRRLRSHERKILLDKWIEFEGKVKDFEIQSSSLDNSFVFNFVEGSLVNAIRSGDWLLLDEINLASSDTLESIADLLADSVDQRSILLSEKGDVEPIKAHPDFRIFGCMNPSTDVGKKDLPLSIRSRFTEIYVHSPDKDFNDLLAIIDKYISRFAVSDDLISHDIANLYLEAKKLSDSNKIVDGANQKPHFSIRTLTRTLIYVVDIISIYGLRRSLYEGFCMSFLTLLDMKSEEMLKPLIEKYTIGKLKNMKSVMSQAPPCPSKTPDEYVQFRHYWMKHGPEPIIPQPNYIITPFVEKNMLNLVRATAGRRFPVLIQGPTSAGKTSMINYLANITGHKFVRINNHEHTDLQEYLGTYVSDSTGKLTFREGILVEAIRNGYWIVLDELNLAPTDILEALNRLLDDNRELFIPETQEVVHPHPEFMLFATQNPPGLYGGRKMLSRAFRNRFLELHFDDIPQDELEIILKERCQIAPSYCKRIVEVYKQLTIQRQSTRLFEQKNSFATLRDLFRWAFREAVGYEELAANGYMLLAERVRKEDEKLVVKQTIEKVMRVKLDMDAHYESLEQKALMNIESSIVWTKAMRRLAVLVFTSMKYKEPLLLVGETGCGKTTVCQVIAQYLNQQLITVNAHQNTETSDILGAQRPVRNRFETRSRLFNNLVTVFGQLNIDIPLEQAKLENLIKKYQTLDKTNIDKELILSIDQDIINSKILFEWSDGPLVHAMKDGEMFLLDEISLADDSVLERLNSVLEPERSLLLAEKGVDDSFIVANEKFQFLATMNPGGDYGKKELSPALRNRFTEIWVPSMDDFNDVRQIVSSKLNNNLSHLTEIIVQFAQYFGTTYGGGNATSGVISLRDILAWVQFINANHNIPHNTALVHGAAMVFIDALGTNNTAYLAENEEILKEHKMKCVSKLSELAGDDLLSMYTSDFDISLTKEKLIAGSFSVDRVTDDIVDDFLLHAPTTAANAMRVIRAMQVHKPILLEGSPGVGKTSLISAIAKATGNNLIRINLSEQTDLVDLFGSDSPAEGGKTGEFVWRDAPFLRAMQRGEWVLLDEMNLASQSILEGLNACLDHRGEAFIPELDKSFPCHPDFTVFAAQNPQYQGGGRKGLPKSFVNRFTVVYVDVLKNVDLRMISNHLYPNIKEDVSSKMIDFMSQLEEQVVIKKAWGSSGGPWEFNLRDTLRWLGLYNSTSLAQDIEPSDYLEMIISQRFRTSEDRNKVKELFKTIFGEPKTRDNYYKKHIRYIQAGTSVIERKQLVHFNQSNHSIPLQTNFRFIEAAIRCINHNLPLILTGPSSSGKTELIRFIAQAVGAKINEFAMNSDVDSMDILGGYEQVDLTRVISSIIINLKNLLQELILKDFETGELNELVQPLALEFYGYLETTEIDMGNFKSLVEYLKAFLTIHSSQDLLDILQECYNLLEKIADDTAVKFEWFDGLLVQAVEKGYWLILDNANLCSPSVLDRLNSLLETNGSLIINECSTEDGQPRILKPHPNFRLFLTMDPKYGELSRAMRNRGIELYLEPLAERATPFDRRLLGFKSVKKEEETDIIEEQLKDLSVGSSSHSSSPMLKFISAMISIDYSYSQLLDLSGEEKSSTMASLLTGLVQFDMFHDIPRWVNTIRSSSEFNDTTKYFANELETRLQLLESMDLKNPLMNVYEAISADFQWTQTFDPAINNAFLAILSNKNIAVSTSEPNYFFYVLGSILEFQTQLYNIEQKAMSGNMADLTYVEKSAAVYLGRNVKKAPRLNVYPFLKSINDFFNKVVKDASVQIFKFDGVFKSLFDLSIIRSSLLTTAHGQNESQIRVYRDLIIVWCKENSDTNIIRDSLQALWDAIAPFSNSLELETGFLMEKIWESFRSSYPNSSQGWLKLEVLINLFTDFDSVAIKQDPESIEQISGFKTNLLLIYEAVIDGSISDNEFEEVVSNLVNGISKLKAISESYDVERTNEFQEEFNLLSMFVQSNQMISNEGITSDLLVMSSYAGRPTIQFSRTEAFKPYPAVLDNLSTLEDGKYSSSVSELFDNSVVSGALNKSIRFQETSGKLLNMKLKDLKTFGTSLIEHHEYLVTDLKVVFKEILMKWIQQTVNVEIEDAQEDILSWLSGLSGLSSQFSSIVTKYFIPACKLVNKSTSKDQLGVAFVLFACGAIKTYLPSSAYDPAIKEHVLFEKLNKQRIETADLVDTWMKASDLLGGEEIHAYKVVKGDKESKEPLKPRVYRPDQSFDNLFEEWKVFMESSVNAEHLEKLLDAAVEVSTESEQLINMFQNNSSQFISRIDGNYKMFSDLNDILKGYILTLKLGYDLITSETAERRRYSTSLLDITNISKIGNYSNVESIFNDILKFSKKQKPDSQISERLMGYMMNVAFAHGEELSQDILNQALQSVYYRWSLRKMKEAEQNLQDESLYKYNDPDMDIEEDFRILFPDYDEVMDVDIGTIKSTQSFDDVYYKLAKAYMTCFENNNLEVSDLVKEGNEIIALLYDKRDKFKAGSVSNSDLVNSVISFASSYNKFTQDSGVNFDFYRESSHVETRKALDVVYKIITTTSKLLEEWPDHATLKDIVRVCKEFLDYPLSIPIARQLQKIEQIYTFIVEWEKYASSKVTLKTHFEQLTNLIVSWRRLELFTWKELFNNEDRALEVNIGKWWFHLFESIILPLYSEKEIQLTALLSALNVFISQTSIGEFRFRLRLVKAFRQHVYQIQGKGDSYTAITNFIKFYEQFMGKVEEKIANERKSLEKDINEVILLASWKDVNIDALKQSARKSHNSLYKIVRKYRSLLASSVGVIIEQGLPQDGSSSVVTRLPSVRGIAIDNEKVGKFASQVSTWNDRPKRLQDLSMVDRNMSIYVKRISEEKLPTLYEYAKEIVSEASRLQQETPNVYTEETKKTIAGLKNEKAKLLSDTLKELRRIGIKTTSKPEVKKAQSSSNLLLSISTSFDNTFLEGIDDYYFKIIDLLPRLKSAVSLPSEDAPQADIAKGFGAAENVIYSLITAREPLVNLSDSIQELGDITETLNMVSETSDSEISMVPSTKVKCTKEILIVIKSLLIWVPRVVSFAIEANSAIETINGKPQDSYLLHQIKDKFQAFEAEYNSLNLNVITTSALTFIDRFEAYIEKIRLELNSKTNFVFKMITQWIDSREVNLFVNSNTSLSELNVAEDIEIILREVTSNIIVVIQKITELHNAPISEEDDDWFTVSQKRFYDYMKSTFHKKLTSKLKNLVEKLSTIEYNSQTSRITSSLVAISAPIIQHYHKLLVSILSNNREIYQDNSHAAYMLATILHTLASKGFCSPDAPSEEKTDDNLKDGTGLGDGEGGSNNTNDVEEDDDLTEQAQTENKEKEEPNEQEDDAVEMEGDMAGDLESGSDQDDNEDEEEEKEDMDEEIDDIDELDPNEIDEKMWDEEAKENKEKESENVPENKQEDMVANEDDPTENQDKPQDEAQEESNEQEENEKEDNKQEEDDDGEDKDVGEQDDEVQNQENDQVDENISDTDVVDLPEDMNLDGDDEGEEEEAGEDDMDLNDKLNEDDEKVEENEDVEEEQQDAKEDVDAAMEDEGEEQDEQEGEDNEDDEKAEVGDDVGEEAEMSEDEEIGGKEEEKPQQEEEGGGDEDQQETTEGVDGANNDDMDEDIDVESAVKQEAGEKGEGSDNQVIEEQDDLGASGGASTNIQEQEKQENQNAPQDDENSEAKESIKELGDALKEFHRRHQEIKEASKEKEEVVEEKANERPDEFEHVDGENTNTDTQAMGAADKDQMQAMDEDKAIDDDEPADEMEQDEPDIKQEPADGDDMEDIENLEEQENQEDADFKGKTKGGFINDRTKTKDEFEILKHEIEDDLSLEDYDFMDDDVKVTDDDLAPISLDQARELWRNSELATQELASGLCEQLRLILEPTLATKLRGDYKTGKRLNMKRIIPYIASEFRKDKIWLRRTKPSKRQYQIMIAVDDSKSMSESKSTELAFHSIALVSKALTQLESGGLSIVRFGEDVKVVHPFDKPFNNQESGPRIFQYFDFQQTRTDIKNLCKKSLNIFETSKMNGNNDLWQLQIIISDGVCEDHETVQALVRKARESRIMLVFVVIDGINSNESILDMSQVRYEFDNNGKSVLKVDKYLDSFPFEFYVVVRNINELPEMLALILRQYFTEIASN